MRIRQMALRADVEIDPLVHDVEEKGNYEQWTRCGHFFPVSLHGIGVLQLAWRGVHVDLPATCLECLGAS